MKIFSFFLSLVFSLIASVSLACQNSTSADRIVYIGDSHTVGGFGEWLAKNLATVTGKSPVKRYGVAGSAAQHWNKKDNSSIRKLTSGYYCDGDGQVFKKAPNADFPTSGQLFQGEAPMVVIALGTNDVHGKCKISNKAEQMVATKELLAQVRPKSKCIWVGPTEQPSDGPIGKNCGQPAIKAFIDNLKETVSQRCTYIDSRKITVNGKPILPNRSDKLHYEGSLAAHWANGVASKIQESMGSGASKAPVKKSTTKVNQAH